VVLQYDGRIAVAGLINGQFGMACCVALGEATGELDRDFHYNAVQIIRAGVMMRPAAAKPRADIPPVPGSSPPESGNVVTVPAIP
jgi:hypothetical protein